MPISITDIMQIMNDKRWTINKEYTGHISGKPQWVLRFTGEFIAARSQKQACYESAVTSKYFI